MSDLHVDHIRWLRTADEYPDTGRDVLVFAPDEDEPCWIGFFDGEQWVSDGLVPYANGAVLAWADLPEGPPRSWASRPGHRKTGAGAASRAQEKPQNE